MSLLIAIFIGILVGAGGGTLLLFNLDHLLMNILLGVCGSIVGLVAAVVWVPQETDTNSLFSLPSIICSVIGALAFVLVYNGIHQISPKRAAHVDEMDEEEKESLKKLDKD